jgi:diguanylate cyclase (GGDEF)-like protein
MLDGFLADGHIKRLTREAHFAELPYNIGCASDVVLHLTDDAADNLSLLAKYFAAACCVPKCSIIIDDAEEGFAVIASNDGEADLPASHQLVLKQAKALGSNIADLVPGDMEAALCLPVNDGDKISGYIYICPDSLLSNINVESVEEIKALLPLVSVNVTQYATKVSSMLDKLTGGLNRKFLEVSLDYHVEKAKQSGGIFSIVMSDLDNFKTINDVYGHQTGDMVIKATGKVIRSNIRKDTPFGRYGGEEFVVILDNTGPEDALVVAENLRKAIEEARLLGSKRPVTGSMGVATYGLHDSTKKGLIEKADKALYLCKQNGRNRCEIYDQAYDAKPISTNVTQGIISGDTIKDAMRIRMALDIFDLSRTVMAKEERLMVVLEKIKEIAEAEAVEYIDGKLHLSFPADKQARKESPGFDECLKDLLSVV